MRLDSSLKLTLYFEAATRRRSMKNVVLKTPKLQGGDLQLC